MTATTPLTERAQAIIGTALGLYSEECDRIADAGHGDGLSDEWRRTARQARTLRDIVAESGAVVVEGWR